MDPQNFPKGFPIYDLNLQLNLRFHSFRKSHFWWILNFRRYNFGHKSEGKKYSDSKKQEESKRWNKHITDYSSASIKWSIYASTTSFHWSTYAWGSEAHVCFGVSWEDKGDGILREVITVFEEYKSLWWSDKIVDKIRCSLGWQHRGSHRRISKIIPERNNEGYIKNIGSKHLWWQNKDKSSSIYSSDPWNIRLNWKEWHGRPLAPFSTSRGWGLQHQIRKLLWQKQKWKVFWFENKWKYDSLEVETNHRGNHWIGDSNHWHNKVCWSFQRLLEFKVYWRLLL